MSQYEDNRDKWIQAKFEDLCRDVNDGGESDEELMDEAVIAYYEMREELGDMEHESRRDAKMEEEMES